MNERHILLSTKRHDWQTPEWFLDLVRSVGKVGFDPCTNASNPVDAPRFLTQSETSCGLRDPWPELGPDELAFVNPPYGKHLRGEIDPDYLIRERDEVVGVGRGWAERIASCTASNIIALVPARTDTQWFRRLYSECDALCLWSSSHFGARINFVHANLGYPAKGSTFPSAVFFRQNVGHHMVARFCEVFGPHGILI
jgi:hypothetical protein